MEALSALLQPYRDIIGQSTGLLTGLQMLSGSVLLNDIRRHGSTRPSDSIVPFLGGLVLGTIALRFGVAIGDDTTIRTNLFGLALSIVYVTFFYWYTPDSRKTQVWTQLGAGGAVVAAVLAYTAWESEELLASRLGMLMFSFVFVLVSLPYLDLVSEAKICESKSSGVPRMDVTFVFVQRIALISSHPPIRLPPPHSPRSFASAASKVCPCR